MAEGPLAPPPPGELASAREADLLLRELSHRTGEEIASALAALHLVRVAEGHAREALIEEAIGRLGCFADLHLILSAPVRGVADAGAEIEAVCRAVGGARPAAAGNAIRLDLPPTRLPARLVRRLVLVAAELVGDGVRNALEGRQGRLAVRLRSSRQVVWLKVEDDRPAARRDVFAGERREIVRELVDLAGGVLRLRSGPRGRTASVAFSVMGGTAADVDEDAPF